MDRNETILQLLFRHGEMSIDDLAQELGISPSTARRDILALNRKYVVEQNRSQVRLTTVVDYDVLPFYKFPVDPAEARALAEFALRMVQQGDVIGLSGGLICTQLALRLRHLEQITVVTNALNVAAELAPYPNVRVMLTGGQINYDSFELIGQAVGSSLKGIWINKFFLGTSGITIEHGITGRDEAEALAAQTLMRHAGNTIVLADSEKFLRPNFATVAPLSDIDTIVTTTRLSMDVLGEFQKTGIHIEVVECL